MVDVTPSERIENQVEPSPDIPLEREVRTSFWADLRYCLGRGYVDFKGKASTREFLSFFLFTLIVWLGMAALLPFLRDIPFAGLPFILSIVVFLGLLTPILSVTVRRLRQLGHHPLWVLVLLCSCHLGETVNGVQIRIGIPLGWVILALVLIFANEPTPSGPRRKKHIPSSNSQEP